MASWLVFLIVVGSALLVFWVCFVTVMSYKAYRRTHEDKDELFKGGYGLARAIRKEHKDLHRWDDPPDRYIFDEEKGRQIQQNRVLDMILDELGMEIDCKPAKCSLKKKGTAK